MEYDAAAKDLRDIRVTMDRSSARLSRDPGWFFLILGLIWLVGYLVTQFAPQVAGPLWIALNVAGSAAMIVTGAILRGRKGRQRHPGLGLRIVAIALGVVAFPALLALSLGLTDGRDITILIMLSTAFCYFIVGLAVRPVMSLMGALLALSVVAATLLWPSWLYLSIAILGGGTFIASGVLVLLQKEKTDA